MVSILLATYQGEKHLPPLLESIFNQTMPHFTLWVRDDGSTDRTLSLLNDPRIKILEGGKRLGAKDNFAALLAVPGDYFFFADQDDIWHKNKLEVMLKRLKEVDPATPFLLHSDLELIDEEGHLIHPSFWRYAHLHPERSTTLNRLLPQNVVTGAATAFNATLKAKITTLPPAALMHDHWLALAAAAFGRLEPLPLPLVQYRQHPHNTLGAKRLNFRNALKRDDSSLKQAEAFLECYQRELSPEQIVLIKAFLSKNPLQYCKHRLFKQGFLRTVGQFLR